MPDAPLAVAITSGTQGANHVVNGDDYNNGIDIGGTGTITVGSVSQNVSVDGAGSWNNTFTGAELDGGQGGDYQSDVTVTLTKGTQTVSAIDVLVVDTVVDISLNENLVGGDGVVSGTDDDAGVVITGSTVDGTSVVVTIDDVDHDAVVDNGQWTVGIGSGVLPQGEVDITVTATDAHGNSNATNGTITVDTLTSVTVDTSAAGGDGTVNRIEHADGAAAGDGVAVGGMAEANATVRVTLQNATTNTQYATQTVTANTDGAWSYTFSAGDLPQGTYDVDVMAVSTDHLGNTATANGTVHVDTELSVATDTSTVAGNGVINILEHSQGVILSGTADPYSTVTVNFGTGEKVFNMGASNTWSGNWTSAQIPTGDDVTATVSVRATDGADNVATASGTVQIDTVIDVIVNTFATGDRLSAGGNGDGVVNAVEHADGFLLAGFADGAGWVDVNFAGAKHENISVGSDGSWSSFFFSPEVPTGEDTLRADVTAYDAAGNVDTAVGYVQIDTLVTTLASTPGPVKGDDVVNRIEANDGVTFTGSVEQNSRVFVKLKTAQNETSEHEAVVANGNWTVTFTGAQVAAMNGSTDAFIRAVDAAGNEDVIRETFRIEADVPDAPNIEFVGDGGSNGTIDFTMINVDAGIDVGAVQFENGSAQGATTIAGGTDGLNRRGELNFTFDQGVEVPDGSHMIVTASDDFGNTNSTLVVLDEHGNSVVDISAAAIGDYNIGAIDLEFAEDSELTLSTADLEGLSNNDNSLIVHGKTHDTLTFNGTVNSTSTTMIEGKSYNVHSVGSDGGELIVGSEIDFFNPVI